MTRRLFSSVLASVVSALYGLRSVRAAIQPPPLPIVRPIKTVFAPLSLVEEFALTDAIEAASAGKWRTFQRHYSLTPESFEKLRNDPRWPIAHEKQVREDTERRRLEAHAWPPDRPAGSRHYFDAATGEYYSPEEYSSTIIAPLWHPAGDLK